MKLLVSNKEIPLHGIVVYDSLNQLYTTIEVISSVYINEPDVILRSDKTLKCKILRSVYANKLYRYTLVSENTWRLLNTNCSAFNGSADVNKLLSSIGLRYNVNAKSNVSWWILPETKFKVVLRYLNTYTSLQSGGAPCFYVDIDGNLSCIDLKKVYQSNDAFKLKGVVDNDFSAYDWIIETPGNVDVFSYSKDGLKRVKVREGAGSGVVKINDTTGFSTELMVQRIKNEFYFNYFTSRKLNVSQVNAESYQLGSLMQIGDVDQKFIIFSRTVSIPVNDEAPVVKLVLCAPCQKL